MLQAGADGTGSFTNNGTVNFVAHPTLAAGTYAPIQVGSTTGSFGGSGSYNALGGTWTANEFVVSAMTDATGGVTMQNLSGARLSFNSGQMVASFPEGAGDGTDDFNATELSPGTIGGEPVLAAYQFDTTLSGTTVQLSFEVGTGLNEEDISIWYLADGIGEQWTRLDLSTLEYSEGWATFTVENFSSYALTVEPVTPIEPTEDVTSEREFRGNLSFDGTEAGFSFSVFSGKTYEIRRTDDLQEPLSNWTTVYGPSVVVSNATITPGDSPGTSQAFYVLIITSP